MRARFAKLILPAVLSLLRAIPKNPGIRTAGVLIFKPDRIGDFVLAAECIRRIGQIVAPLPCTVILSQQTFPIARRELPAMELVTFPARSGSFTHSLVRTWAWARKQLGDYHWQKVVNLRPHLTLHEDVALECVTASTSFGLSRTLDSNVWPNSLCRFRPSVVGDYPVFKDGLPTELESFRQILAMLGVRLPRYEPRLKAWEPRRGDYLLISPFAGEGIRNYPPHALIEAVRQACEVCSIPIRLCVEPQFAEQANALSGSLATRVSSRIEIHTPRSAVDFIDQVAGSRAVLAMESAAAHLAVMFGKPGTFIIGGGHYGAFAPWGDTSKHEWLTNELPCFGCNWRCTRSKPECITGIPAELVASKLVRSLEFSN